MTDKDRALQYRLWLDRQLYGNSFEKVSRVPCDPCQQIGECPRCKNTRFVEVRERVHPLDVIVRQGVKAGDIDIRGMTSCASCGTDDCDLEACFACGRMFCVDCTDFCSNEHDPCDGEVFCKTCQEKAS